MCSCLLCSCNVKDYSTYKDSTSTWLGEEMMTDFQSIERAGIEALNLVDSFKPEEGG